MLSDIVAAGGIEYAYSSCGGKSVFGIIGTP
jgi:hypothetical protein